MDREANISRFSFLVKNWKIKQIVYTWKIEQSWETLSPRDSILWYWINKQHVQDLEFSIFWNKEIITLPINHANISAEEIRSWWSIKNITNEFLEYISLLASEWILKEKNFSIWKEILSRFELFEKENPSTIPPEHIFLNRVVKITWWTDLWNSMDLDLLKEYVVKKEFLDWLIKFKPYQYRDVVIERPYWEVELNKLNLKLPWQYTSELRYNMFKETKYFKNRWSTYQPRQWMAKLYEGWITAIIAPRRWGKTNRAASRMVEELLLDQQNDSKPNRIIYIWINRKKNKSIINYVLSMVKPYLKDWYMKWSSTENVLTFYEPWETKDQDVVRWTIEFIWAKDDDAWVWDYARLIVIDECERIPENVWDDVYPIITNEQAKCILISTLNKRSEKSWFYKEIIEWEKDEIARKMSNQSPVEIVDYVWNKYIEQYYESWKPYEDWINLIDVDAVQKEMMFLRMHCAIRFTWEDIDIWYDRQRDTARKALMKRSHDTYMAEWWGIFPDDTAVYDFQAHIKKEEDFKDKKYKYVVCVYDPAEHQDYAALKYIGWDDNMKRMDIFMEKELPWAYINHWPLIKQYLLDAEDYVIWWDLENKSYRVYFVYDHNGVWRWLQPYFISLWIPVACKVVLTNSDKVNIDQKTKIHNVWKSYAVNIYDNAMDLWWVAISDACKLTIDQMWKFKWFSTESWYIKYKAESKEHDDFVLCDIMGAYFILHVMWEQYKIAKKAVYSSIMDEDTKEISPEEYKKFIIESQRSWVDINKLINKNKPTAARKSSILSRFWY